MNAATDLVAFLNARLDEDAEKAKAAALSNWSALPSLNHPAIVSPGRQMWEVEAKRKIIAFAFQNAASIDGEWGDGHTAEEIAAGLCDDCGPDAANDVLRPLAAIYSDHPDYQEQWVS